VTRASDPVVEFDLCGPLPQGVTLLEASAGTGKTFAIAALVARLVAEGVPTAEILVVTFTRMATGELRERVRDRLVSAEVGLARALQGVPPPSHDEVLGLLSDAPDEDVERRRRRLARAISGFDAATIATTHGFCQHVLAGLGVAGDVDPNVTFVEDLSDLVEEVVDDLYVRRFHRTAQPAFDRSEALRIGHSAIANPLALLEPVERRPEDEAQTWAMRRRLAHAVREELESRKRRGGVMTYDDLLTRLRNTLADQDHGAAACAKLRERYRVALVDEFQDTDPIQWDIMRLAFGEGDATLILIGDPKQAVYSFRGADVYAYLGAADSAGTTATLATNWRSDQGLIDALDAVFDGAQLGHEGIVHRRVRAAARNREPRLVDAPVGAPLRVRLLHSDDGLVPTTRKGYASKPAAEALIADDLAADVVRLLSSSATLLIRDADSSDGGREHVQPRHIAVLVPTNKLAALVDGALERVGIPSVINGVGSVFGSPAAEEWLRLLEALERPVSTMRAGSAALTSFLGWTAERMAAADEPAREELHAKLHQWAGVLRDRGIASLFDSISVTEAVPRRVLARVAGERRLTDLGHVAQLLHAAATEQQLGVSSLTSWLRQRIVDADRYSVDDDRALKLDSDAEAVQVLTIHRSKGLEFPIVYHPFAWQPGYIDNDEPPAYHDDQNDDVWTIDVGGKYAPDISRHRRLRDMEQRGEDLRLLYVALTRAMHQATVWSVGAWQSHNSPLGRLLFARDDESVIAAEGTYTPSDDEVAARFETIAARVPGRIAIERVAAPAGTRWTGEQRPAIDLAAASFPRSLDARWRRVSYSSIVSGVREQAVATESEVDVVDDELIGVATTVVATTSPDADEQRLRATPSLLSGVPGGADVGDLFHRVLAASDFACGDLKADLLHHLLEQRLRRDTEIGDPDDVIAGLAAAIETPLGPLFGETRLRDVATADRLDELSFELPLVGGDTPTGTLALGDIASLLDAHLPAGDPLGTYADRLRDPFEAWHLRGYLTGILDLVVRIRRGDGKQSFALVDYKSNWLGADGGSLSAWHYRPSALAEAMEGAHYPLQALLYLAALHRFLRARLTDYDAEQHLAGVLYLFLRGMSGADTPRVGGHPCGVFAWRPPAILVSALSDLLDRGGAAA
jgi:exodeoxyribonuclease V beta subunit